MGLVEKRERSMVLFACAQVLNLIVTAYVSCSRETCDCEESEQLVEKGRNVDNAVDEYELQKQLPMIMEERGSLLSETKQMSLVINESEVLKENYNKKDASTYNKEKTKLRMHIRWMQPELDAHCGRLQEAMNEMKLMDARYHEASIKLKKDLAYYCHEVLRLREELKESQGT